MKKIIMLTLVLGLFSCNSGINSEKEMEVGEPTSIQVKEVYNMGDVAKGELVTANIKVKNTGKYPLLIANIEPACSCTVSEYEKKPIPPGETTIIKATVDTDKTGRGTINKPINITANTQPSTTTVTIRATVK